MAEREQSRQTIATLPNLLGIGRIVATPIVMALLLAEGAGTDLAAGIIFVAAALSDILDGWIARSRDEVTPLGVFMDLAADKVLVVGTSLTVYPAAGLVDAARPDATKVLNALEMDEVPGGFEFHPGPATRVLPRIIGEWLA